MRDGRRLRFFVVTGIATVVLGFVGGPPVVAADDPPKPTGETTMKPETKDGIDEEQAATANARFEIYGFVMTNVGYRSGQIDPDWYEVMRPTKLPAYKNEFGADGNTYFSVRPTRFGGKAWFPTKLGELYTILEFELFGVGDDAGQTTLRLRHAYGELGQFGVGQTRSPFMDFDVFPNSIEYWGPSGMVFFRNIQVRWMPIKGDTRLTVALERPGASGDEGRYNDDIALDDVALNFPLPDLSAEYRRAFDWGYLEVAGILRYIEWEDLGTDQYDLTGDTIGWGINLSSNIKLGKSNTLRLQVVYGEAIENYMDDASVDIGIEPNPGDPTAPIKGVGLPVLGVVAFLDHSWSDRWSTAIGFSLHDIENASGQDANAFSKGEYALVNLLCTPAPNVMVGVELQYGRRENYSDGWSADDLKIQFSFKYDFSHTFF